MPFVLTAWVGENNWLLPPVSLVPRVIRHLFLCRSMGTLIVPKWVSAPFWPMFFGPHSPVPYSLKRPLFVPMFLPFFFCSGLYRVYF